MGRNTRQSVLRLNSKVRHVVPKRSHEMGTTRPFSVENEFDLQSDPKKLIIAEINFFNTKNQDAWQKANGGRPSLHFARRGTHQREPSETCLISINLTTETVFDVLQTVTREYREEFLREPVGSRDHACWVTNARV